jgi:hypothetical protein
MPDQQQQQLGLQAQQMPQPKTNLNQIMASLPPEIDISTLSREQLILLLSQPQQNQQQQLHAVA